MTPILPLRVLASYSHTVGSSTVCNPACSIHKHTSLRGVGRVKVTVSKPGPKGSCFPRLVADQIPDDADANIIAEALVVGTDVLVTQDINSINHDEINFVIEKRLVFRQL